MRKSTKGTSYKKQWDDKKAMEKELGYLIHEWNEIYQQPAHRNIIRKVGELLEYDTSIHEVHSVKIYDDFVSSHERFGEGPDIHCRTIRTFFMKGGCFDDDNIPTKFNGYGSGFRNQIWYTDLKLFRNDKSFK